MVRTGAFELQICVAGAPLPEFTAPSGETYVEAVRCAPRLGARALQRARGHHCCANAALRCSRCSGRCADNALQRFDTAVTYAQSVQERDPYGEMFTQSWPVTPYTLRVINRSPDHVQAVVFIDGARASRQFVDGGAVGDIRGFKDKSARCEGPMAACPAKAFV